MDGRYCITFNQLMIKNKTPTDHKPARDGFQDCCKSWAFIPITSISYTLFVIVIEI